MCANYVHIRMKSDPVLFLACPFVGITKMNGRPMLLMRNCPRCNSTLGLPMAKVVEMYPGIEAAL